ncbi:hypothetical protein Taro_054361 [Colocasia esculenta]|uniref:Uncharacterized protein n=1 Tax=Colocasia esculenta TaxID=4460 RepID=A0A843XQ91_COLES|nr:hypothetical protein [Colocasia esculenta]
MRLTSVQRADVSFGNFVPDVRADSARLLVESNLVRYDHDRIVSHLVVFKGRVEELLVAEELWNDHKKPFFFLFSSAATCTNHPLEVDQRSAIQGTVLALSEPGTDPVNATARYVAFRGLIATNPLSLSQGDMRSVAIYLPDLTSLSRCLHTCVVFWA